MKKVGLVLAGGGGRGAYQIGVWKALRAAGLEDYISAVSGTSVGGLNAALFIKNDLKKAQDVWESISRRVILTPKLDSSHEPPRLSLFERDGLETIIDDCLDDMSCFDDSDCSCWMACRREGKAWSRSEEFEIPQAMPCGTKVTRQYVVGDVEYFNLKHIKDNDIRKKIILATSAMCVIFPKETIGGQQYYDGGSRDNVPVRPLYKIDGCNRILVVHLTNNDEPVNKDDFQGAILYEIFPKGNLGSILDFSAEGAKMRINQGYEDNIELFKRISDDIRLTQTPIDILRDMSKSEQEYEAEISGLQAEFARGLEEQI